MKLFIRQGKVSSVQPSDQQLVGEEPEPSCSGLKQGDPKSIFCVPKKDRCRVYRCPFNPFDKPLQA